MRIIINLIVFLFILTTIVSIHEFGHFIAAKIFGVYCGAFSIGMGPKIFHKKGKETEFQIRALPIGGLREKSLAALRSGIKTIIVPKENKKDVDELPKEVKDTLQIVFMSSVEDAVKESFVQ